LEGYGVAETSPVISLSTPAFNKDESAGLFLPKINYSLAEVLGVKDGGRLSVKGPNIMMGSLHADQPGVIQPTRMAGMIRVILSRLIVAAFYPSKEEPNVLPKLAEK
jgi:acyl-CoA synthetase (AMP-forming)/AMP-acid ligase II